MKVSGGWYPGRVSFDPSGKKALVLGRGTSRLGHGSERSERAEAYGESSHRLARQTGVAKHSRFMAKQAAGTGVLLLFILTLAHGSAVAWAEASKAQLPSAKQIEKSVRRGLDFLLRVQNSDGSWGSPHRTKDLNIFAPVPGAHHAFRTAVTAMCVEALIEVGVTAKDAKARAALDRGEQWLLKNLPAVRRAESTAIYNVWTHAYGIQALVAMHRRADSNAARREQIRQVILTQIDLLRRYESVDGGWGYYDFRVGSQRPASSSTSFVTATVLIAFRRAKDIGLDIPNDLLDRGIASINRQRKNDFSYAYGEYLKLQPMMPINRPAGSLGRSQACNLALRVWGDETITSSVLTNWLDRLIVRNEWLSFGRKRPIPHESWFQVAGYFFYYGHYYAALCLDELERQPAKKYQDHLAAILLPLQERDGSWWDFPLYNYHQQYGTAFALMSLSRCRNADP